MLIVCLKSLCKKGETVSGGTTGEDRQIMPNLFILRRKASRGIFKSCAAFV